MRSPAWHCGLLLTVTATVHAQTPEPRVDPPLFRWLTTQQTTGFPFGYADRRRVRVLEVHDAMRGPARTVRQLALRRAASEVTAVPEFDATVTLVLGTATTTAASIDAVFAANLGSDATAVLDRQTISLPRTEGPFSGPAPFDYVLPAVTPFAFGGQGPLCVDLTVHDHTNRTPARFALFVESAAYHTDFGIGCAGLELSTTIVAGIAQHTLTGAPPNAPVVPLLGANFEQLAGQPLPLDLTPLGATECRLALAPLIDLRGFTDPSGTYRLELPLTGVGPGAFYGLQVLTVQPGINALGLALSDTSVVLPIADRIAGRVWSEDLEAAAGRRQPVFASILEVR